MSTNLPFWKRWGAKTTALTPEAIKALNRAAAAMEKARELPEKETIGGAAWAMRQPEVFRYPRDPFYHLWTNVTTDTLRMLAINYDVLAACIAHHKSEVTKIPVKIVQRDSQDKSAATITRIADAERWFGTLGGMGGAGQSRQMFEGEIIDDLLVIGYSAMSLRYNTRGSQSDGNPDEVIAIDASTVERLVDEMGFPPSGYDVPAYRQWVQGREVGTFTRNQMVVMDCPAFAQTRSPYPLSPVELVMMTVFTALKSDEWNRTYLTHGTTKDQWMEMAPEMSVESASAWLEFFNKVTAGNSQERRQMGVTPGKVVRSDSRKEQDFEAMDERLALRTMSLMGVNPASIGWNGGQYESNQEAAMGATEGDRVAQLRMLRLDLYNDFLYRKGFSDLMAIDDVPDSDDRKERAETEKIEIECGRRTINQIRLANGEDPVEGGDTVFVSSLVTPLEVALNPPAPPTNTLPPRDNKVQEDETKRGEVVRDELRKWQARELRRLKDGEALGREFVSTVLTASECQIIRGGLVAATTPDGVKGVFQNAGVVTLQRMEDNPLQPWTLSEIASQARVGPDDNSRAMARASKHLKPLLEAVGDAQ